MFVCIAGKNNIAVDILEYLIINCRKRYELGVVCNKNENGINGWQKSLRYFAKKYDIREYSLEELYEKRDLIFISLEFERIVNPKLFLRDARLYNIHFSLLPQYKGMYTSAIPILNGEQYVGVTFHKIDSGIDTGEIICQKKFELSSKWTCRELYLQYIKYGTKLVLDCIENVLQDKISCVPQSSQKSTYYSKKYIDYSNLVIDLNQTADGINRQLRAFTFREYQMPEVYGEKIICSQITDIRSKQKPGTIISRNSSAMMVATIDYNILLFLDRFNDLMDACKRGDLTTVKEICSIAKHINESDEHGWTPLIVATYNNHIDIVEYLLLNGANIFAKNNNGTNLLMYAKEAYILYGERKLFDLFCELGLSPKETDYSGKNLEDYLSISNDKIDGV